MGDRQVDDVVEEIDIDAPVEHVFEALTDPAQVAAWLTEQSSHETKELRDIPETIESRPPYGLTWRWREPADGATTAVRWELTPTASGTHVRVIHRREVASVAARAAMRWEIDLFALRRLVCARDLRAA